MLGEMKKLKSLVIMTSCVLLTLAISPGNLFAETVIEEWVARYNGPGNSTEYAKAIVVDDLGNVYVTGSSNGIDTGLDYATVKYDTNGNELWVARYNGPGNSNDEAIAIALDSSGNVYVTGYTWSNDTADDYATIKYDTNGNQVWVATYNGTANGSDVPSAIALDNSGNVYVTGYCNCGGGIGALDRDYATVKYDRNGNELWTATYNGPGNGSDMPTAIALDNSGNVYVTGHSSITSHDRDYATIKYDTNGNELWVARYDGPINSDELVLKLDWAYAIAVDASGNVYVTGRSLSSESNVDYATVKYDSSGNELWVARYDYSGYASDEACAIAVDGLGNVYVTGGSWDISTGEDYATIKYDTNGNQIWAARYSGTGNSTDAASAIAVDASGNVYVTGGSWGISTGTDRDYATIKYDSSGNELWVARYNGLGNSTDWADAIVVDSSGNVYITGDSVGSGTEPDYATVKYSQLPNQPPVADAGLDQALLEMGTTVALDGDQSYDLDGDPITYWWTMIEMPVGSAAVLSNPTSAWPSFVADLYGDYVIELVVSDPWDSSDPDMVTVSFDNVMPVADAGVNQAVIVGDTVNLDGSGSNDINGDPLTFSWIFESVPAGSLAVLFDADTVNPSFAADEAGTYVVSLIVNDGLLDSDADTVSIEAISSYDALVQILFELIDQVNLLPDESLKNRNLKNALTNKINDVLSMIDDGLYVDAKDKLQKDILGKTNGCAEMCEPDKNDWITTCPEQGQVYPLVIQAIALLEELI